MIFQEFFSLENLVSKNDYLKNLFIQDFLLEKVRIQDCFLRKFVYSSIFN